MLSPLLRLLCVVQLLVYCHSQKLPSFGVTPLIQAKSSVVDSANYNSILEIAVNFDNPFKVNSDLQCIRSVTEFQNEASSVAFEIRMKSQTRTSYTMYIYKTVQRIKICALCISKLSFPDVQRYEFIFKDPTASKMNTKVPSSLEKSKTTRLQKDWIGAQTRVAGFLVFLSISTTSSLNLQVNINIQVSTKTAVATITAPESNAVILCNYEALFWNEKTFREEYRIQVDNLDFRKGVGGAYPNITLAQKSTQNMITGVHSFLIEAGEKLSFSFDFSGVKPVTQQSKNIFIRILNFRSSQCQADYLLYFDDFLCYVGSSCRAGYYKDDDACIPCDASCLECSAAGKCTKCPANNKLVNAQCQCNGVNSKAAGGKACSCGNTAIQIASTCQQCDVFMSGCLKCSGTQDAFKCLACMENGSNAGKFVLSNNECRCKSGVTQGIAYDSNTKQYECKSCSSLILNCVECINSMTCKKCVSMYGVVKLGDRSICAQINPAVTINNRRRLEQLSVPLITVIQQETGLKPQPQEDSSLLALLFFISAILTAFVIHKIKNFRSRSSLSRHVEGLLQGETIKTK